MVGVENTELGIVGHKVKIQSQQTPFLFGDISWGYGMSSGWKQGIGWGKDSHLVKRGLWSRLVKMVKIYFQLRIAGPSKFTGHAGEPSVTFE